MFVYRLHTVKQRILRLLQGRIKHLFFWLLYQGKFATDAYLESKRKII